MLAVLAPTTAKTRQGVAVSRRADGNIQGKQAGVLLPGTVGYPVQAESGTALASTSGDFYMAATDRTGVVTAMPA